MRNNKYLYWNILLIFIRKVLILLFFFIFLSNDNVKLKPSFIFVLFDELCARNYIYEILLNPILFGIIGKVDFAIVMMGFILFTLIYCSKQNKKDKPNNKLMLTFTIIHAVMILIYFYAYYVRLYFYPIPV